MSPLPAPVSFQILSKAFTLPAQRIEAKYKNSRVGTHSHYSIVINLMGSTIIRRFPRKKVKPNLSQLTSDPA